MVRYPEDFQQNDMLGLHSIYKNGISIAVRRGEILNVFYAVFIIDDLIWDVHFETVGELQSVIEMVFAARG